MKKILSYLLIVAALVACSENEPPAEVKATLTASKTTLLADGTDEITFTVINQDGKDVTSGSVIKVNGNVVSNPYKTTEEGNHTVVAVYNNVQSNEITIQANKPETIVLEADKVTILSNGQDKITFTVKKPDGTDITSSAKIKVNNIEISGNTYVATKEGEYKAVAVHDGKESNTVTIQANKPQAINLSADKLIIDNTGEDKVTFTVKKPDGTDITGDSKFFINEKEIEGNVFTSTETGTFNAHAMWEGNKSNNISITVKTPTQYNLVLTADKPLFTADGIDMAVFTCINKDDNNNDLTKDATFFVNGEEVTGNTFSTNTAGEYKVMAKFSTHESGEIKVTAQKEMIITPKILLEDYTGTWCPNCPRCIKLVNDCVATGKVVGLAIHQGDIMEVADGRKLMSHFKISGFPTIMIDRDQDTEAHGGTINGVLSHLKEDPKVGAAIDFKIDGNEFVADVNIVSKENRSDIKVAVFLAENGIKAAQAGDSSIDTHYHALRAAHNGNVFGEDISVTAGTPLKKTFKFPLSNKLRDENQCEVIVMITKRSDNIVLNVQRVLVNGKVGY